jgi:hypothetical protein
MRTQAQKAAAFRIVCGTEVPLGEPLAKRVFVRNGENSDPPCSASGQVDRQPLRPLAAQPEPLDGGGSVVASI